MTASRRLFKNSQETILPLPDVRHSRDQPLRRQEPGVFISRMLRLSRRHPSIDDFMDYARFPGQPRSNQEHRGPIPSPQQLGKLLYFTLAANDPLQIVGIQMI